MCLPLINTFNTYHVININKRIGTQIYFLGRTDTHVFLINQREDLQRNDQSSYRSSSPPSPRLNKTVQTMSPWNSKYVSLNKSHFHFNCSSRSISDKKPWYLLMSTKSPKNINPCYLLIVTFVTVAFWKFFIWNTIISNQSRTRLPDSEITMPFVKMNINDGFCVHSNGIWTHSAPNISVATF